jgi:hypothetical protein
MKTCFRVEYQRYFNFLFLNALSRHLLFPPYCCLHPTSRPSVLPTLTATHDSANNNKSSNGTAAAATTLSASSPSSPPVLATAASSASSTSDSSAVSALVGAADEFDAVDDDHDDDDANGHVADSDGADTSKATTSTTTKPLSASQHVRLLFAALHSLVVETDLVRAVFECLCFSFIIVSF